jgi:ectoine hydroxylase-related dioxygenase (phytanoyl-CoA dioxygenase family)
MASVSAMESSTAIPAALHRLGVGPRSLADAERRRLDEQGFIVLSGVVDDHDLTRMRTAFDGAGDGASAKGTRHVDLLETGEAFDGMLVHPGVLAAALQVLGEVPRLAQLHGREPLKGFGAQGLHSDWLPRPVWQPYRVLTTLWLLDDFRPDNGATGVVPGSHRQPGPVPRSLADPGRRHPEEHVVTAPAGSVLVFNGHLWHAGTVNRSGARRRVVQALFTGRRERAHHGEPPRVTRSLEPAVRWVLALDETLADK